MRDGKVQSRFTARRQEFARNTVLPHRGMSSAMSHGRLVLFVSLILVAGTAIAGPPGGRRDRQDEPRIVVAHETRPNERSLADDVRRVKRETGGQILSAERVPFDGRDMTRIKVLDETGRVRVITETPKGPRPPR